MLALLHLCDSLFPLGAFSYSDGLETAAAQGAVHDAGSLREWLDAVLDESFGRFEGPAAWQARALLEGDAWEELARLDAEVVALRPSSNGRRATCAMGQRLLTTWHSLHPDPRLDQLQCLAGRRALAPTLPIAFAAACLCAAVDRHAALEALAYTRLASTVSAAMRVAPIGQSTAHALLSETLVRVPQVVRAIAARDPRPESFAPGMDIVGMEHQYLHSRLFRS
jgi:urease accessory protein